MILSGLILQLRRKYNDVPKAAQVIRAADGVATLFNVGRDRIPVVENSYSVYFGGTAKTETADYSLDKDSGDLQTVQLLSANTEVKANFKYADFRDQHWVEAVNEVIDELNGRGFYKQVVGDWTTFAVSAGKMVYSGPTGGIDVYEVLQSTTRQVSGATQKMPGNWTYQSDSNQIVLGYKPTLSEVNRISYLRKLNKYTAVSATLDVRDEWITLLLNGAGAKFFNSMASKIAREGNASVKEGHMSYTSLRAQARELEDKFIKEAARLKPTRPAKDLRYHLPGGGN